MKFLAYVFTNLGKEGREGPANASGYMGTTLEGQVTLNAGIQMWQVPYTDTYIIESRGAAGADGTCYKSNSTGTWQRGGWGAKISGKFWLTHGTLLKILVGQRGMMDITSCYSVDNDIVDVVVGGGGGGSFVTYVNNTPLIIAGGGGGGSGGCGGCDVVAGKFDGDPGQLGVLGSRCNSTVGNGGMICSNEKGYTIDAGSGAGLLSNGRRLWSWVLSARCFVDGGRGGTNIEDDRGDGGFGGGGSAWLHGGGGGGYTGGGVWANSTNVIAGGGGSVNHGFDKQFGYGDALEHGLVKIVFLG